MQYDYVSMLLFSGVRCDIKLKQKYFKLELERHSEHASGGAVWNGSILGPKAWLRYDFLLVLDRP